jgi:ribosomal protein S20
MHKNQQEYNKRWADRNKDRKRYLSYKSTAKTFIRKYANGDDLKELERMIKETVAKTDA